MRTWEWVLLALVAVPGLAGLVLWWWARRRWRGESAAAATGPREWVLALRRLARMVIVLVVGVAVLLLGLFLALPGVPGPGVLVMLVGLAILATEFVWAEAILRRIRRAATRLGHRAGLTTPQPPPGAGRCRQLAHRFTHFWVRLARRFGVNLVEHADAEPHDRP